MRHENHDGCSNFEQCQNTEKSRTFAYLLISLSVLPTVSLHYSVSCTRLWRLTSMLGRPKETEQRRPVLQGRPSQLTIFGLPLLFFLPAAAQKYPPMIGDEKKRIIKSK